MANAILPTNGTHELQERYANAIVKLMRKTPTLRQFYSGRDYEGSPKSGSVTIPVRNTEVRVGDYDVVAGGELGTSATEYLKVLVDKDKYVNELIDGYEAQAVPDNLVAQRLDSASYSLARRQELDFISEILTNGTPYGGTVALTNTTVYNSIVGAIGELRKRGIDPTSIIVAVPTATVSLLNSDIRYTNTASTIGSERVMTGAINMIDGATVVRSENLGDGVEYAVYSIDYAQAGDEWSVMPSIQNILDGKHIGASALQGRMVYFNKVTNALGIIKKSAIVSESVTATVDGVEVEGDTGYEITVAKDSVTTAIEFQLNTAVELVGTPTIKQLVSGVASDYGTIALDSEDSTKIIVTPSGSRGTAAIVGEFSFYLPAGSILVSATQTPNTKIDFTLTVTE